MWNGMAPEHEKKAVLFQRNLGGRLVPSCRSHTLVDKDLPTVSLAEGADEFLVQGVMEG
jgi:hypothetical protein